MSHSQHFMLSSLRSLDLMLNAMTKKSHAKSTTLLVKAVKRLALPPLLRR